VRIPVLAGVATVSRHPENWIDKLVGAAAPPHRASLLNCRKRCGGDGAGFELTIGAAADPAAKPLGW